MSYAKHENDCPLCRPAVFDPKTGEVLADDTPIMKAIMAVWDDTSWATKEAFHRVTCLNSREDIDLKFCAMLNQRFVAAIHGVKAEHGSEDN